MRPSVERVGPNCQFHSWAREWQTGQQTAGASLRGRHKDRPCEPQLTSEGHTVGEGECRGVVL